MKRVICLVVACLVLVSCSTAGCGSTRRQGPASRPPGKPSVGSTEGAAGGAAVAPDTSDAVQLIMSSATTIAFKGQSVDERLIEVIVEAGIRAPSAQNRQPWHFSVLTNRDLMEKMNAAASGGRPLQPAAVRPMFENAPLVIIASGLKGWPWSAFDCGLACENMNLAAQSLGLGVHILASPVRVLQGDGGGEFRRALGIPENMEPLAVLAIGYPDTGADAVTRASTRARDMVAYVK